MKKIDEETLIKNRKINRRLLTIYRSLSTDLLFYYTISYLFLINIKGMSTSKILFADAFYPIFKLLLQIPITLLIKKIGKRNSIIIANISILIYLLFMIFLTNMFSLIIANIFYAIGYVTKGICETNITFDSLEDTPNKRENFTKLEGNSIACFSFLGAITALATGFIYTINPYIPMILSLLVTILTIIIAFALKEVTRPEEIEHAKNITIKKELSDLKDGFKFVIKSGRLKSLIICNAILMSVILVTITLRRSLLNDVNVSAEYFGLIFAALGLISAFSSSKAINVHLKLRNKALTIIGFTYTISVIISGLVVLLNLPNFIMYFILLSAFAAQFYMKDLFCTLIRQYLNSFSNSDLRLKIYSANACFEFITYAIVSLLCSYLLKFNSTAITSLVLGISSTLLLIPLIKYMKKHLGLKPEEYSKEDIIFNPKTI